MNNPGIHNRWHAQHLEFVGSIDFDGTPMGGMYFELDVGAQLRNAEQAINEQLIGGLVLVLLASGLSFAMARTSGAMRSLRAAEANFQALIEQSPLPYAIFETSGSIRYSNPAFRDLLRKAGAEFVLDERYNAVHDTRIRESGLLKLLGKGFADGPITVRPFRYELVDAEPEQDELWIQAVIFPLENEALDAPQYVVVLEDITASKLAEIQRAELDARILQSQKLEGLGVMAGGIAHDFNNLLTPVQGNAELIQKLAPPDSNLRDFAGSIIRASTRAADLCDQLLAYAGHGIQTKTATNISNEVREMNELFRTSLAKKTVLVQELSDGLPPVMADQTQLRQIILNLLINGSEALDDKPGTVTITTGVTDLSQEQVQTLLPASERTAGEYVYLEVRDNGHGMDEETQEKLFNPFFSTKFTGRGLGLSAVIGIVSNHAGGISVESTPGVGSTFTVYLPSTPLPRESTPGLQTASDGGAYGGTVLLVDDEESVLEVGVSVLESMGFSVITAVNGEEALQIFRTRHEDLVCVFLDMLMPSLDGRETLTEMRIIAPDIPVVIATGYTSSTVAQSLANEPQVIVMQKPYQIADLEDALHRLSLTNQDEEATA